ncbi:hypothetical protein [Halarcobacter ebronensis]|uniref:Mobilization protein n=1 Tax=Halarcobacter ebronensis TaxID=1462615 RepID=A0A4Q1B0I6_9BACT|nr:hypothetical protein [Halarcobacter ebronensis]QKF80730.1 hypothetical protein AEBR_0214 [Halarcobacter ebronensis]RXK08523.1 hypothetical protein CRV07_01615 [Halarcobacter ebronensis]
MAISSIHIENGKLGYFAHNSRETETKNSIFTDEKNYCSCSKDEAFKIYRNELNKRKENYVNSTKQKFQPKTITHLSAILNFNKEHTAEDIKKVCNYLEELLDTKVIQYSMHRDEGHTIENSSEDIHNRLYETVDIKNYHAHIELMGIDSKGKSLKQKIDKPFLKQLQTDVAKILNMQRGQESGYSKEEYKKIQEQLDPLASYPSKKVYNQAFNKVAKELGYTKDRKKPTNRLDTYEFKDYAAKLGKKDKEINILKKDLAKQKDLKEEIAKLRIELKENTAVREDYAKLEQLNKELKQQIKDKNLTIEELQNKLKELEFSMTSINKKDNNTQATHITQVNNTQLTSYDIVENSMNNVVNQVNQPSDDEVVRIEENNSQQSIKDYEIVSTKYNELLNNLENLGTNLNANETTPKSLLNWIRSKWKEFKEKIVYLENKVFNLEKENEQLRMRIEQPTKVSKYIEKVVNSSEESLEKISSLRSLKEYTKNESNVPKKSRKNYE